MSKIDEAWNEFRADLMTDPVVRYAHTERDVFDAGWKAAQRRNPVGIKRSLWVHAPTAPNDDPES